MMDINRHNYRVRAMEYIEDTLPGDVKGEFESFLSENEDIASEIASLKESVPVLFAGGEVFPYKNELRAIAGNNRRSKVMLLGAAAALGGFAAAAAIAIIAISGLREEGRQTASGRIATVIEVPAGSDNPAADKTTAENDAPAINEVQTGNKTPAVDNSPVVKKIPAGAAVHVNKATAAIENTEDRQLAADGKEAFEVPDPVLASGDFVLPVPDNSISLCDLKTGFAPERNIAGERMNNDNIIGELSRASRTAALILASIDSMLPIRKLETESETVYHIASIAIVRTSNK